ncbi:hypothetical protein OUZ56_016506 [Daphnia magna]|uniref:Uncharacterized protein n=1 Tax=Daphnia magna TaxID=35525 RepID=A0ABR0AQV9_9CRUS|nr:hypothetical protein OUZ56_016506 [Daphnia magna]
MDGQSRKRKEQTGRLLTLAQLGFAALRLRLRVVTAQCLEVCILPVVWPPVRVRLGQSLRLAQQVPGTERRLLR